jgi:hypothetical protein
MSFVSPMGQSNMQLSDALKRLSAAKYGKPRSQVEKEIFGRLAAAVPAVSSPVIGAQKQPLKPAGSGSSFLDEWLSKRQQMNGSASSPKPPLAPARPTVASPAVPTAMISPAPQPIAQLAPREQVIAQKESRTPLIEEPAGLVDTPVMSPRDQNGLHLRGDNPNHDTEISVKLR